MQTINVKEEEVMPRKRTVHDKSDSFRNEYGKSVTIDDNVSD